MVDKLGIDSALRLSGMYHRTKNYDPFPIKEDAPGYALYGQGKFDNTDPGTKIYNAGVTCRDDREPSNAAPLKQLKHIWE